MRVVIGGGGTAGHIVPGIALYHEFKRSYHEMRYVLRTEDLSYDLTSEICKKERFLVSLKGVSRKLSFQSFFQVYGILKAWFSIFQAIKKFNPDVFVITGGYVSNIVALSAFILNKPLFMLEQNSVAGVTNRFWASISIKIFTVFPNVKKIPLHKIQCTGNPILYTEKLSVFSSKNILGLENNVQPVLGISSGSQGSKMINDLVLEILPDLVMQGYQIVWSVGTCEYERLKKNKQISMFIDTKKAPNNIKIFRFITRMDAFWSVSDIVLARSGAGTVSEAMLFKKPALFIPIYASPDNHQYLNARFLEEKKCACILNEPDLTEKILLDRITWMMENRAELQKNYINTLQYPEKKIVQFICDYLK